jgi:hypothetical protein
MRFALAPILTPGLRRSVSDHRASSAWCVARKTTRGARLASNASGQHMCTNIRCASNQAFKRFEW